MPHLGEPCEEGQADESAADEKAGQKMPEDGMVLRENIQGLCSKGFC